MSEKRLGTTKITRLLKQYVAWAIAWKDRYRSDLFFYTTVNVIALQALFIAVVLGVFWATFQSAGETISREVISSVVNMMNSSSDTPDLQGVARRAREVLRQEFFLLFSISAVLIVFFGYTILRSTLSPARNTLKAQKMFISNVAHELRTPLSIIKTRLEVLLLHKELDTTTFRQKIYPVIGELDRTSDIINNLLSLDSYLKPNRIRFSNIDLGKVVDETIEKMKVLAANKQISISVQKRGDYETVWGNATSLEQVISNLLRNSIRYTPSGGHIVVSVEPDYYGSIILTVQDTGIGIREKDLFHIFEPYYRGEKDRARTQNEHGVNGSGLGLTIVNEVIKSHKGKISVQSAVGSGTTVQILLPCGHTDKHDFISGYKNREKNKNEVNIDFS